MNILSLIVGVILLVCGAVAVVLSVVMLAVAAIESVKAQISKAAPLGGGALSPADWANLLEAIAKLPGWAIAMLAGDVQIWFGLKLMGVNVFG